MIVYTMDNIRITYQQAVSKNVCILCGQPAVTDASYGAAYCAEHKREIDAELARARREHPGRFRWEL